MAPVTPGLKLEQCNFPMSPFLNSLRHTGSEGRDSMLWVQLRVVERSAACDPGLWDEGSKAQLVTLASAAPLLQLQKWNCFSS